MHVYTGAIFQSGGSQAIRIPKECRFPEGVKEVSIYDSGDRIIIMRRKKSLDKFFKKYAGAKVDPDFLKNREDLPPEERELFE